MILAIISPIPDLERFATQSRMHMVLAEYLDHYDDRYLNFYKYRRSIGEYVIMDNGAHEHDMPMSMPRLMELAVELQPSEIILPDVQRNRAATVAATALAIRWLEDNPHVYDAAGKPALQIVPQGENMTEWISCRYDLLLAVKRFLHTCNLSESRRRPVIGIAKHNQDTVIGGVERCVSVCIAGIDQTDIHMLGWPRELNVIPRIARNFPQVRSVDTARPIAFAKHGLVIGRDTIMPQPNDPDYPDRGDAYFTEEVPTALREAAMANIGAFNNAATGLLTQQATVPHPRRRERPTGPGHRVPLPDQE